IIGTTVFKRANSFNILAMAAIVMLMYDPYYLFQVSFQFSFISLLSILYFQPKIKVLWTPQSKQMRFFWDLINVSLAAQILIFPFTIFYFHQFPIYFAISGIVAVPLVTLIIYVGFLLIITHGLTFLSCQIIAPIFVTLVSILNMLIKMISHWPCSKIQNIWITDTGLILMVVAILTGVIWYHVKNIKWFYVFLGVLLLVISENRIHAVTTKNHTGLYIYDCFNGYLIDIIDKGTIQTIAGGDLTLKNMDFAAKNNRIKFGVNSINEMLQYKNSPQNSLCVVNNELVYILDSNTDIFSLKEKTKVKVLFVTGDATLDPLKVISRVNPDIVIIDRSVKPWNTKKWLHLPLETTPIIHMIKEDGAFILEL
ncbi:MAG: ComEC/Rec2 family competence protein, partial [Saprospiraceae bacterium]